MTVSRDDKVCTHCGCNKPLSHFKRRSNVKSLRLSWCRDCINEAARMRAAVKKRRVLGQTMKTIRLNSPASRVECVIKAACRKAGGIEAFGGMLVEALESVKLNISVPVAIFFMKLAIAADRLRNS